MPKFLHKVCTTSFSLLLNDVFSMVGSTICNVDETAESISDNFIIGDAIHNADVANLLNDNHNVV